MKGLQEKVVVGAAWMIGMRLVVNGLGLASTVILARLLTPADFGVTALAGSAYAFFSVLGQFGFDSALIQKKNPEAAHYDSAWTANILVGCTISAMMFAVASPAAEFFNDSRIEYVVYAFAALSILKGLENVGVVNFRKSLKFRGDFYYFVIPKIVSFAAAIAAAVILKNYWALVIGMVAMQFTTLIYSHVSQPFRPKLGIGKIRELLSFSQWIVIGNFLRYLSINSLEIIIGRLLNASAVGLFGISRTLATLTSTEIVAPINRALFPSFSGIADDLPRLRKVFKRVIGTTALISIPAAAGIFAVANQFVLVLFGEKWIEAIPVIQVLALVGIISAVQELFEPLLLSRGKPGKLVVAKVIFVVTAIPSAFYLIDEFETVGVAYAILVGTALSLPYLLHTVMKEVKVGILMILSAIWRPVLSSTIMVLMIWTFQSEFDSSQAPTIFSLATLILVGIVSYLFTSVAVWLAAGRPEGAELDVIALLRSRFHG